MIKLNTVTNTQAAAQTPTLPNLDVRVYPTQGEGKTLAFASMNLGGVFAITGLRVMDSAKGIFVAMPDRKGKNGEYREVCFPTTKEMREAVNRTVLAQYQKTVEKISSRGEQAAQKASVRGALQDAAKESAERATAVPAKIPNRDSR